ncbi:MAG: peptide/nickel transport system permease protein [Thermomicrobiales bacterium]|jgi:peptide/nickel transport system permease protein|nr:peptide/nickel transport system permease protein [Thermomicrobiales bacterium]
MEATQGTAAGALRDSLLSEMRLRAGGALGHVRHNPKLLLGLVLLVALIALGVFGPIFIDTDEARPMSVAPDQKPSREYPFGTESQGRDMLALVVRGIPLTIEIGLIAGAIGLGIGTILGFVAGYTGGIVDTVIRSAADIILTVPGLLVLIVVAASIKGLVSVQTIAFVVASLAWMFPTRTIRSQVLSLRERPYVEMAKLNGMSTPSIIGRELVPNLLPYLGASFVGAVGSAILAAIGLEALGLGPQNEPTLGMTIYWAIYYSALLRGLWWWWAAPVGVIVVLFVALFLIAAGLDELANPRLRRSPA